MNTEKYIEQYDTIRTKVNRVSRVLGSWIDRYALQDVPNLDLIDRWMKGEEVSPEQRPQLDHSYKWIHNYNEIVEFVCIANDYIEEVKDILESTNDLQD